VAVLPAVAQAATSKAYNSFNIPRKYEECPAWYESNRPAVLKASNCQIIKDLGDNQYQVQCNTPLGACRFVMKETRKDSTNDEGQKVTTYFQTFVRNISGRMTYSKVTIQFTEDGDNTKFQMWMTTSVSGRLVPAFAVYRVQQRCLSGCEAFVKQKFPSR
jgi:hypothetical protein